MSPRWLHWPAAGAAPPSYDILQVTGPGGNGSVNGVACANGTVFTFSSGDFEYDTWGIVSFGIQNVLSGYVHFQFISATEKTAFVGIYSAATGFTIQSSGIFSDSVVTFTNQTGYTDGVRFNAASPAITPDLITDLNSAGVVVTFNNP